MSRLVKDKNTKTAFIHFLKEHSEYRFEQALTIFLHQYISQDTHFVYMTKNEQDDANLKDVFYFEFDKEANNGI